VDHVLSGHFRQPSQNALEDEFAVVYCVFREVVESAAKGVTLHVLQGQVD
jgi:hypothetical protein